MLLTLSNPVKANFDFNPHAYSPLFPTSTAPRSPPRLNAGRRRSPPAKSTTNMTTPHRGLPPPSAMTLPDPGRAPPPVPSVLGAMPQAPAQWQGAEDGMKNWLATKAEEERRKQEEEKTRQETLRLEQRRIEQSMLREAIQGGVPAHLVPIIFAGISGGNLVNISAEWIQQYATQIQAVQQKAQAQLSPTRDARLLVQSQLTTYPGPPQLPSSIVPSASMLSDQPLPSQMQHAPVKEDEYPRPPISPRARAAQISNRVGAPTSAPRPDALPQLTTNETNIPQPPTAAGGTRAAQQAQPVRPEKSSPFRIHHWVPPTSASSQEKPVSGIALATPSSKYRASPSIQSRQRATSHASDLDYIASPRKRKAQGPHQPAPPPTSAPQSFTSPSFSHLSTPSSSAQRGRARARSDASHRGAEGSSSASNRRGTVSGAAYEPTSRQGDVLGRLQPTQGKGPESTYASPSWSDGRFQPQQEYTATSMPQPETPKYDSQQAHWDRRYPSSPKREAGDYSVTTSK